MLAVVESAASRAKLRRRRESRLNRQRLCADGGQSAIESGGEAHVGSKRGVEAAAGVVNAMPAAHAAKEDVNVAPQPVSDIAREIKALKSQLDGGVTKRPDWRADSHSEKEPLHESHKPGKCQDDQRRDVLALEYMTLTSDARRELLQGVVKRMRWRWIRQQQELQRRHENQVVTHRPININDARLMLAKSLSAQEMRLNRVIRFKFAPLQMWHACLSEGIIDDLVDRAIDLCIWE